jgi:hypothetical protein
MPTDSVKHLHVEAHGSATFIWEHAHNHEHMTVEADHDPALFHFHNHTPTQRESLTKVRER